jgi:hypothetical protein
MKLKSFIYTFILIYFLSINYSISNDDLLIKELSKKEKTYLNFNKKKYFEEIKINEKEILKYKNRRDLLKKIVNNVIKDEKTDLDKIKKWVIFLQHKIVHPKKAPKLENGQAIYDPIWILVNKLAHCGQVNRLILDGLMTQGFNGRLVQLKGHVIAEVYFKNKYMALDADLLEFGGFFYKKNFEIASSLEIFNNQSILNNLKDYVGNEYKVFGDKEFSNNYWFNYLKESFSEYPYVYYKFANNNQLENIYYGWNYYIRKSYNEKNILLNENK